MPTASIPFGMNQESGLSQLGGGSPAMMNVVRDAKGAVRRRPGISAYSAAPTTSIDADGITGLYAPDDGRLFAVGGGDATKKLYRVLASGAIELGSIASTSRPTFAETEAMLAICGGGPLYKVLFSDLSFSALGGGPPALASHVIANSNRLLANDLDVFKNQVFFSAQAAGSSITGHETWDSGDGGYVSADARPDAAKALGENSNEVFVWGPTNVQIFTPDADLVYASTTTRENGCSAPGSVIKFEEGFAWLDHARRIVIGSGRSLDIVSGPIQSDLDDIDVTGCFGYRVSLGTCNVLAWTFPVDGRTFVYSPGGGWGQWAGFDDTANSWTRFMVNAYFQRPDDNTCLVGTTDGIVGELDFDTATDLGDVIKASCTTGFIGHDTSRLKQCQSVRLLLKRGTVTDSTTSVAFLSYRDDLGSYSDPLSVSLGATGERYPVVQFRSLGAYRTRQWKIEFAGSEDFELVGAEEDFTVLGV